MGTAIAFSFPLGRYHATPWDHSVNDGAVEWPPSPWRVLRALLSTWHLRGFDIDATVVESLLTALRCPPSYRVPPTTSGHSRHYLPDLQHKSGQAGNTDLTLDPFLCVDRQHELLIAWDVELAGPESEALSRLCLLMPYLGRSESLCNARLVEEPIRVDDRWWQPQTEGHVDDTRMLVAAETADLADLEITTHAMRRSRRLVPSGARYVGYRVPQAEDRVETEPDYVPGVEVIRWRLRTRAPFREDHAVLATEQLRHTRLRQIGSVDGTEATLLRGSSDEGSGKRALSSDHQHAHWLWLSRSKGEVDEVQDLALWFPAVGGIPQELAAKMLEQPELFRPPGGGVRGFQPGQLHLVGAGQADAITPELVGPGRQWRSRTPYLIGRHRHRNQTVREWVASDVVAELAYRGLEPDARSQVEILPNDSRPPRQFRRYRRNETMAQRRPGVRVRLTFAVPVRGPLSLGALNHFGFGLFEPDDQVVG